MGPGNRISEEEGETVAMMRLDEAVQTRSIKWIDLWKLDVEGFELPALEGAESLLKEKRIRALYVELVGEYAAQVPDYLKCFGYEGYAFTSRGRLVRMVDVPEYDNRLFLPSTTTSLGSMGT